MEVRFNVYWFIIFILSAATSWFFTEFGIGSIQIGSRFVPYPIFDFWVFIISFIIFYVLFIMYYKHKDD